MIQVIFNDKKSYTDMHLGLESFSIQAPSKKKVKDSVPFMNSSYDFSTVGSGGEITYTERIIKIRFNLKERNRGFLYNKYSEVLEWLIGGGQKQLIFTDMPDCYFLAEVEEAPSFEAIVKRAGIMEIEFTAEPFRQGVSLIGQELWDTFNFETDYMQDSEFDVVGSKTISLVNPGRAVVPMINCNSSMTVSVNGYAVNFIAGDNRNWRFKLQPGANTITINGTGHIKFIFRKEVL